MIGTGAGSDYKIFCRQFFAFSNELNRVLIQKTCAPLKYWDVVSIVEISAHTYLFVDHPLGVLQYLLETQLSGVPQVSEHRVGIKLHDLLYGVA